MMPGGVYSGGRKILYTSFIADLAKMLKLNGLVRSIETLTPQTPLSHEMSSASILFRQFRESGRAAEPAASSLLDTPESASTKLCSSPRNGADFSQGQSTPAVKLGKHGE